MFALTLLVASVALADSINPSTVIPGLWLASAPAAGRLASFTLGVFAVYATGGLALLFGPGRVMIHALRHFHGPFEHALEVVGGLLVLVVACVLWRSRSGANDEPRAHRSYTRASAFALGAGIMAFELPTAFMYFGVISAILAAHPAAPVEFALVVVYNVLFVAPLIALLGIRRWGGTRVDRWIASAETRVRYVGQLALSGVAALAGTALLAIGVGGLLAV
jgi:Sap, sulfolipid-1-addressing protein